MNITLYAHGGSANHGCEAIVRSTAQLLSDESSRIMLLSEKPGDDVKYKLDEIVDIRPSIVPDNNSLRRMLYLLKMKMYKDDYIYYKYMYSAAVSKLNKVDIALSVGGDNYCYSGFLSRFSAMNNLFVKRRIPIALWGCSIDDFRIDKALVDDLKRYNFITARESQTYRSLVKRGLKNVKLIPDSAFTLNKEVIPVNSSSDIVGLNLSTLICQHESKKNIVLANFEYLIEYILKQTDFEVMLIPHVVSDIIPLKCLYEKYSASQRVKLIQDNTASVLKGYISRCRFMIAARTHASIAGYSTSVPTLVIGYSVKSVGIARDLFGTDKNYVISVEKMSQPSDLTESFKWVMTNEDKIHQIYDNDLSSYIDMVKNVKISDLIHG